VASLSLRREGISVTFDRELIEAKIALGLIPSREMPAVAQEALEAGLDGRNIVRLAVLQNPTFFEVAEVLPKAKKEMALVEVPPGKAALRIARRWAAEILERGEDPLRHTKDFNSLFVKADYPRELASVGNLDDDVWVAESMGEPESRIREWVTERLRALSA
jgi:hypothetical protein